MIATRHKYTNTLARLEQILKQPRPVNLLTEYENRLIGELVDLIQFLKKENQLIMEESGIAV